MKQQILLVTVFEPAGTQCSNDILISHLKSSNTKYEYDHLGRNAWGWVEYDEPLSNFLIVNYELTEVKPK